jgi:predicted SAM-dependent methyltransferase
VKINLGCGQKSEINYVNIDKINLPNVDQIIDLDKFPFPFNDLSVDEILCRHYLNHSADITQLMNELFRIIKKSGLIKIYAPHFSSDNFKTDPTHKISLGFRSMNYFSNKRGWDLKYTKDLFEINIVYLCFYQYDKRRSVKNIFYWIGFELFANSFPRFYERYLSAIIPCNEIYFELKK